MTSALIAATAMRMRCASCVPSHAMIEQAAEQRADDAADRVRRVHRCRRACPDPSRRDRRPRARAGSSRPRDIAAGSTAHRQRTRSIWNCVASDRSTGPDVIGQYGSCASSCTRPTRSPRMSNSWHTPSARLRIRSSCATSIEPTLLPMPSPARNAARMSENVYVVAPSSSDSRRVHTASAASAVAPDSAIVDVDRPRARRESTERGLRIVVRRVVSRARGGVALASARLRQRDGEVDRHGDVRRIRHVVHAQQIEAGEQTAEHRAGDVAAVEEAEPRDAFRRRLHPARDRRQRRAHEQRRRQQAERAEQAAEEHAAHAVDRDREVQTRPRMGAPTRRAARRRRSPASSIA